MTSKKDVNKKRQLKLLLLKVLIPLLVFCLVKTAAADEVTFQFPKIGSRWQYVVHENNKSFKEIHTVVEQGLYKEKTVRRLKINRGQASPFYQIIHMETGNWITTLLKDKPINSNETKPHNHMFNWPLSPGKKWSGSYSYSFPGKTEHVNLSGKVNGYEEITVPAGTFKALRVSLGDSSWFSMEYWYSPELSIIVKRNDWAHYKGKRTMELSAYKLLK